MAIKDTFKGTEITANDFNGLKSLENVECKRRKGTGSVEKYAGGEYQFVAAVGYPVTAEHYKKLYLPAAAINSQNVPNYEVGDPVELDKIADEIIKFNSIAPTNQYTGCAASCTGLCSTGCYSTCSGCTGTCQGCTGCTGSCRGCSGSCSGRCGGCDGSCGNSCNVSCDSVCKICTGHCTGTSCSCHGAFKGLTIFDIILEVQEYEGY